MRKSLPLFAIFVIASLFSVNANAQTPTVQKAFDTVKERVDDLVTAKDVNNPRDLAIRIETFAKVIDLSQVEAKELKKQLLQLEFSDETLLAWKVKMLDQINIVIEYYDIQQKTIASSSTAITLESIKTTAEAFKTQREKVYVPIAEEVYDMLIIFQEREAIVTAKERWKKISDDITKLQNAKVRGVEALPILLSEAKKFITKSEDLNTEAYNTFLKNITPPPLQLETKKATSTATSTIESKTITLKTIEDSSEILDKATTSVALPPSKPSIKDLVRSSLVNIRDAYQVFIEMSSVVRALFN